MGCPLQVNTDCSAIVILRWLWIDKLNVQGVKAHHQSSLSLREMRDLRVIKKPNTMDGVCRFGRSMFYS